MNSANKIAKTMTDYQLISVARALEAELMANMPNSQATLGKIELMTACTDELVARGYLHGRKADGSDLPRDVSYEHAYGSTVRLSRAIRCF